MITMIRIVCICIAIIYIHCQVESADTRSKLFISKFSFDPSRDNVKNVFLDQQVLHFEECNIRLLGWRFYYVFQSAKEIIFENCFIEFDPFHHYGRTFGVEKLTFINTTFDNEPATSFRGLHNLTCLVIDSSSFKDNTIDSNFFGKSRTITHLNITRCRLKSVHRATFTYLPNLEALNLEGNHLTRFHKIFIRNVKLRHLDIASNYEYKVLGNDFPTSVEWLNLANNNLSVSFCRGFKYLHNLKYLNLSNVMVGDFDACLPAHLISLEVLDFSHNDMRFLEDDFVAGLENIRYLYLNNDRLTVVEEGAFYGLLSLELLNLADNYLRFLPIGCFRDLRKLRKLNLGGNRVAMLSGEHFKSLVSLMFLNVTGSYLDYGLGGDVKVYW